RHESQRLHDMSLWLASGPCNRACRDPPVTPTQRSEIMRCTPPVLASALLGALVSVGHAGPAQPEGGSNVIVVTTTDDSMDAFDQQCSLREALHNANTNSVYSPVVNECAGGSAAVTDVIVLVGGAEYHLTRPGTGDD